MRQRLALFGAWVLLVFTASAHSSLFFETQPSSSSIAVGTNAFFRVSIGGESDGPAHLQWFENGVAICGATNLAYVTPVQETPGQKVYQAVLLSDNVVTGSEPAILTVRGTNEPGLLAHWSFDEFSGNIVPDSQGHFHGEAVNAQREPGRIGSGALALNGTNAYVLIGGQGTSLELTNTAYTISWWQQWDGPTGRIQNIYAMDDGFDYSGGYSAYLAAGSSWMNLVHATDSGAEEGWYGVTSTDTNWHHYAVIFDGAERRFYVDGQVAAERPTTRSLSSDGDDPLLLGALQLESGAITNFFKGTLDEVRIYSRALNDEEIIDLGGGATLAITRQPESVTIEAGTNAVFTVGIGGSLAGEAQAQWYQNGVLIPGATNFFFETLIQNQPTNRLYQVVVRAGSVEVTSETATLKVLPRGGTELLAHWSFSRWEGDVAEDVMGNYPGQVVNAVRASGLNGGALGLNGTNGYVVIGGQGTPLQLTNTAYTISWWQKWGGPTETIQNIYAMDDGQDYSGGYSAYLAARSPWMNLVHATDSGLEEGWYGVTGTDTNWHHYAVTFDGAERRFYEDGRYAMGIPTGRALATDGDDPLILGALRLPNGTITNFFKGELDEIRIYSRSLTETQIKDLSPNYQVRPTQQPQDITIPVGTNAVFSMEITGYFQEPPSVQWDVDGVAIPGATNLVYRTPIQLYPTNRVYQLHLNFMGSEFTSSPATLTVVPGRNEPGLIAHWSFDEEFSGVAGDLAGNFPGEVINGNRVSGLSGGALELNGRDAYMFVGGEGTALALTNSAYTISWWQKWAGPTTSIQNIYAMDDGEDYSGGYSAYLAALSPSMNLVHATGSGAEEGWYGVTWANSVWHHYAVSFDSSNQLFYVDGKLAKTRPNERELSTDFDDPLIIGALRLNSGQVTNFFKGTLDEVRIYSRALAIEEIQELSPDEQLRPSFQPMDLAIEVGMRGVFEMGIDGYFPESLRVQWYENGVAIPGATNLAYRTPVQEAPGTKVYEAKVESGVFEITSRAATLIVFPKREFGDLRASGDLEPGSGPAITISSQPLLKGAGLTLAWPEAHSNEYRLEYATNLGESADWTELTENGGGRIDQAATNEMRFYRLRKP